MSQYLLQGFESEETLDIVIGMTNMTSEPMIKAVKSHLVNGMAEQMAIKSTGVTDSNFTRAIKNLNEKAGEMHKYFELEFKRASEYELFREWNEFKQNQISDNK